MHHECTTSKSASYSVDNYALYSFLIKNKKHSKAKKKVRNKQFAKELGNV